jgi:Schlafen, AlbA_2
MGTGDRPLLSPTIIGALSKPTQTSLSQILAEYGWLDQDVLGSLSKLKQILDAWEVDCIPPIGQFGLDDVRVLRSKSLGGIAVQIADEIHRGEGAGIEFKESLLLDVKKHTLGRKPIGECMSNEVTDACLKTVAGFMNTSGGTLLIGVVDNGTIAGLEREYCLIPGAKKADFDEWELHLRSQIDQRFHNGRSASASVHISRAVLDGKSVARVLVGARKELVIMKGKAGDLLYIRAGNRTLSVTLAEMTQYFSMEKRFL